MIQIGVTKPSRKMVIHWIYRPGCQSPIGLVPVPFLWGIPIALHLPLASCACERSKLFSADPVLLDMFFVQKKENISMLCVYVIPSLSNPNHQNVFHVFPWAQERCTNLLFDGFQVWLHLETKEWLLGGSSQLVSVTSICKPFKPFGRGTALHRGLINHGY